MATCISTNKARDTELNVIFALFRAFVVSESVLIPICISLMQSKKEIINTFDPNGPGIAGNLFGLPFSQEHAEIIIIPVPWEITVSYHTGTSGGPSAILQASSQLDLYMKDIHEAWKLGVSMLPIPVQLLEESQKLRELTSIHIARLEKGEAFDIDDPLLKTMNEACENLNIYVKSTTQKY